MKIDERIILYLDNQMSEVERNKFEFELKNSTDLTEQMEFYKTVLNNLKVNDKNELSDDYFVSLVPNFREKLRVKTKPPKIKIAYSLTAVASILIISVLFLNPFRKSGDLSLENLISTFNVDEKVKLFNYYNNSNYDQDVIINDSQSLKINDLILSEINLQASDVSKLISSGNIDVDKVYSELQPEEADKIYNEILNIKFF